MTPGNVEHQIPPTDISMTSGAPTGEALERASVEAVRRRTEMLERAQAERFGSNRAFQRQPVRTVHARPGARGLPVFHPRAGYIGPEGMDFLANDVWLHKRLRDGSLVIAEGQAQPAPAPAQQTQEQQAQPAPQQQAEPEQSSY